MYMQTDLIALIEQDLGPGRKSGRWSLWRCPFHQDHSPSLAATNGDNGKGPYWKCFSCSDKHGDPLAWLITYRNMGRSEAIKILGSRYPDRSDYPQKGFAEPALSPPDHPPGSIWQQRATQLLNRAVANLWDGAGRKAVPWQFTDPNTGEILHKRMTPREWLSARGLRDDILRLFNIGYIPPKEPDNQHKPWCDEGHLWGLEHSVKYSSGILIPCMLDGEIWYLKTRSPSGKPKYLHIRGSRPALYMVQTLQVLDGDTVVFCEGELDALLLWQEIGYEGFSAVVTLGSASAALNVATWGFYLLNTKRRFTAYDPDRAGEQGAARLSWMHTQTLAIPKLRQYDKDLTDFHVSGGNLLEWMKESVK